MPRPKKDGEKVSLFLDRELMKRLREEAEQKGQSLTVALERAIKEHLDTQSKEK